jgi:hypothetical protein
LMWCLHPLRLTSDKIFANLQENEKFNCWFGVSVRSI